MKFSSINLNNIKVINKENNFLDIKYNSGKLEFETPEMYLPFGLESNYGNYYLKLQFRKDKDDIVEFYNFIEILEDKLKELLGTQNVPSQMCFLYKLNSNFFDHCLDAMSKYCEIFWEPSGQYISNFSFLCPMAVNHY